MDFINQNMAAVSSVISLAILITIYFAFKYRIDFALLNLWYGFPVIGKMTRLAKDSTRFPKDGAWTNSERVLCHDYKQFVHFLDKKQFEQYKLYLSKADDSGRTPMPKWMLALLAVLVVAEGLGFSYLLGSWMAMEGSESTRQLLMIAIVFVLCVILLFVTHGAGHQLYGTNMIRMCDKEWRDDGQPGKFKVRVDLSNDQHQDDDMPEYSQCASRLGAKGKGSLVMLWVAALSIVLIAVGSTWMRLEHLKQDNIKEVTSAVGAASADTGNPFSTALPVDITAPQKQADQKAANEISAAHGSEGLAAFLMLAFIFVVTQVVGIAAGYKYGFGGRESKQAYEGTRGFATYHDYETFYEPIIQKARSKLQTLQQLLAESQSNQSLKLKKSFDDYIYEEKRDKLFSNDEHVSSSIGQMQGISSVSEANIGKVGGGVEHHLEKIDSFGENKESAKAHVAGIADPQLKSQVIQALKTRKEAREKQLREQDAELDGLF